jgi:hypothetical protein
MTSLVEFSRTNRPTSQMAKHQGRKTMVARWASVIAVVSMLGSAWQPSARAQDPRALVEAYLEHIGAIGYTITAVTAEYIDDSFPDTDFFEVIFRVYPVAVLVPKGLSASNVFLVQNATVLPLVRPANLKDFFSKQLAPVRNKENAEDAGLAWLRLTEAFSQDGFFTFADPQVKVTTSSGKFQATGSVSVATGGRGSITVTMSFGRNGVPAGVSETRNVHPGVRPICQATKLLDTDPLVRRMAEQDILVMGRSAKQYLDQQRAKATPELRAAIDRIWKRIVNEGW